MRRYLPESLAALLGALILVWQLLFQLFVGGAEPDPWLVLAGVTLLTGAPLASVILRRNGKDHGE